MTKDNRKDNGGPRPGSGRKANPDKLNATVTFRIKEPWRDPIKKVVREEIIKLKRKG